MKSSDKISIGSIKRLKILWPLLCSLVWSANLHGQVYNSIESARKINSVRLRKPEIIPSPSTDPGPTFISARSDTKAETIDSLIFLRKPRLPLDRIYLTSGFGNRKHPVTGELNKFHSGIDLDAKSDTIYCILHGVVKETGYNNTIGNFIRIAHGNYTSVYGHLSILFVKSGELIAPSIPIGISGATGRVTGEHLHFSVKYKDQFIDPLPFLVRMMNLDIRTFYHSLRNQFDDNSY